MMSAHGSFSLGKGFPGSLDASQLLCNLTAASSASCWLFYFLVRLESCDGQTGRHARLKYFHGYCMQQVQVEGGCRHGTARHSTAQHGTARHSTAQHGTARHSTAQHGTARHSTAQHSNMPTLLTTHIPLPAHKSASAAKNERVPSQYHADSMSLGIPNFKPIIQGPREGRRRGIKMTPVACAQASGHTAGFVPPTPPALGPPFPALAWVVQGTSPSTQHDPAETSLRRQLHEDKFA